MAPKIVHSVQVTPHKAGLYETARDLAEAERRQGLDAKIVDPIKTPAIAGDRGVPVSDMTFFNEADVIINHSGLSAEMNRTDKPIIHMLHGRPHSSFLLEQTGRIAVYSFWRKIGGDPRYKRFVTFWPEFMPYFANILPADKLYAIPAPVDMQRWQPGHPTYDFHGKRGKINLVISDMWREDKTPYHVVNAAIQFAKRHPGTRVHVYAPPQKGTAWGVLKAVMREAGCLGEKGFVAQGLDNIYRTADVLLSPHWIATRAIREALACACKVVMAPGNDYTPYTAEPEHIEDYVAMIEKAIFRPVEFNNRESARKHFDSKYTAEAFLRMISEVTNGRV